LSKSRIIKFFNLSFYNKLLLFELSFYTVWAYIMIRLFSFKRYLKWISNPKKDIYSEEIIKSLFFTIRKIDKFAFWPTTCYTQAISARLYLRRKNIKSKIYLGMTKDENNQLLAHAWTKIGDKIITGGNVNLDKYKVLYIFED